MPVPGRKPDPVDSPDRELRGRLAEAANGSADVKRSRRPAIERAWSSAWLSCSCLCACLLVAAPPASAFTLAFEAADFGLTPTFSNVQTFAFDVEVDGFLVPGVYSDPALVGVQYNVAGTLSGTPSGFPAFNLQRTIGGAEYYAQGSSLQFEISPSANLADGLQVSELVGDQGVFVFDGREVDTGRYHPALFELNADGTGLIRNSNNMGGVNPASMQVVDVQIGEEYVTELSFDPNQLTLAVPEPDLGVMMGVCGAWLAAWRRRSAVRS